MSKGMVSASNLAAKRFRTPESEATLQKIERIRNRGRPLGEIAGIHVGLQTLADEEFIPEKAGEDAGTVVALDAHGRETRIESAVTRPIIKASLMKVGKERSIMVPYIDGRLIAETDFMEQFPMAYRYMAKHKTRLPLTRLRVALSGAPAASTAPPPTPAPDATARRGRCGSIALSRRR